ncbi:hypothetical protein ACF3NT_01125 [Naumannella halotolerans]|uniref:putative acetyltransferase n=1 Tax=Naumannella halotolerans TaxID=993414 RepID=UPI00370DBBE5
MRHRIADGSLTDVVGQLLQIDDRELVLRDRRGQQHRILRSAVVASRRVPDRPPPRRRPREN